jgi:predicted metal-binding membrane protein
VWAILLALSAFAWLAVAREDGAAVGLMGMSPAAYAGGWLVMTAAMMLPAIAWFGSIYRAALRRETSGIPGTARMVSLAAGYMAVWSATAAGALGLAWGIDLAAGRFPDAVPWMGGGFLVAAGVYQLSAPKQRCLARCRSPLSFALAASRHAGALRDFTVGLEHGAWCVACCWALMATVVAVGTMSLAWMAAVTLVILLERSWRHGEKLSRAVGVCLVGAGLLVPFVDRIAPALHGGGMGPA